MTDTLILPPQKFYMVRHGESEANVRKVAAGGNLDSPLTEAGIQQAKTLAAVIHYLPIRPSRMYHSPQIRAKDTARHLNNSLQLEMVEMDHLREHIFGDWEDVEWTILRPLVDQGENPPNGESYDEFAQRVRMVLHKIFETKHDAPPILVAHGGLFRSIARLYKLKIDPAPNCCLYEFTPTPENSAFPWVITSHSPNAQGTGMDVKVILTFS